MGIRIQELYTFHVVARLGTMQAAAAEPGVDGRGARYGTRYSNDFLTVKAAVEGQGLALLSDVYVKESLAAGQLVRALDVAWPSAFAYYAVVRKEVLERPAVAALVAWLQADLA